MTNASNEFPCTSHARFFLTFLT